MQTPPTAAAPPSQVLNRLGHLHLLSRKVTEYGARPPAKFCVGDPPRVAALAAGVRVWGPAQDLALLQGILQHGGWACLQCAHVCARVFTNPCGLLCGGGGGGAGPGSAPEHPAARWVRVCVAARASLEGGCCTAPV